MSGDGMLSQEEIDALLGRTQEDENDAGTETAAATSQQLADYLNATEQDALGEIGNIAFGSAATALSTLLNQKVDITTPHLSVVQRKNLSEEFPTPHVLILVSYTEGFEGSNVLVIKKEDASIIADLMMGGDGTNADGEIDEIKISAIQEAMNQMMGSSATSMSTIFNKRIDISPPKANVMDASENEGLDHMPDEDWLIKVSFKLKVGELIDSNIMQLIPIEFAGELVSALLNPDTKETAKQSAPEKPKAAARVPVQQTAAPQETANRASQAVSVQPAAFSDFAETEKEVTAAQNIDLLLDIPLEVTVELGRTKRRIRDILELSPGSIVELDKLAGEPVDILINQKRIAKGEVVVIDENFGVRITEILTQADRLKHLNN